MCCSVKYVPASKKPVVQKCYKDLSLLPWTRQSASGWVSWCTPYQGAPIPRNGLLMPDALSGGAVFIRADQAGVVKNVSESDRKLLMDDWLSSGCIHSWQKPMPFGTCDSRYRNTFVAYAIGVVAWGDTDLCSFGLYIPELDMDQDSAKAKVTLLKRGSLKKFLSCCGAKKKDISRLESSLCL